MDKYTLALTKANFGESNYHCCITKFRQKLTKTWLRDDNEFKEKEKVSYWSKKKMSF